MNCRTPYPRGTPSLRIEWAMACGNKLCSDGFVSGVHSHERGAGTGAFT
jgi:hypothetical protein